MVLELSPEEDAESETEAEQLDPIENARKELERVTKEKKEAEKKAADYYERLQRMQADMENLQKFTRRQSASADQYASERIVSKLLPIVDALQQAENIAKSNNSLPPEEIAMGLKMLHKQLTEVLASEGLEEIDAMGRPLDPERHEVVSYIESDDKPENTVVEEIQKGYSLNGKVIRPSLVVVSKSSTVKGKTLR